MRKLIPAEYDFEFERLWKTGLRKYVKYLSNHLLKMFAQTFDMFIVCINERG